MDPLNSPLKAHSSKPPRRRSSFYRLISIAALSILAYLTIRGCNYILIGNPVYRKLASDSRNETFSISAHYAYYVQTGTLVLDLTHADNATPADLFRGIFQTAEVLTTSDKVFDWVVLASSGEPTFLLSGADFTQLGREFSLGQNPVYLIRTLPEKLLTADGKKAYSEWEGGILGVVSKQMSDASDAARKWATGKGASPHLPASMASN